MRTPHRILALALWLYCQRPHKFRFRSAVRRPASLFNPPPQTPLAKVLFLGGSSRALTSSCYYMLPTMQDLQYGCWRVCSGK